jgi:hypothetical protein
VLFHTRLHQSESAAQDMFGGKHADSKGKGEDVLNCDIM